MLWAELGLYPGMLPVPLLFLCPPILPIAIYNSKKDPYENINKKKYLFLKIKIIFGDLIDTESILSKYPKKEAIDIISNLVMDKIKILYSQFNKE